MKRIAASMLFIGWLIGAGCGVVMSNQFTYRMVPTALCDIWKQNGVALRPGTEVVPNQPNPCYVRDARLHLPSPPS